MRLGGEVKSAYNSPQEWAEHVYRLGYSAVYCPVDEMADSDTRKAYREMAQKLDVVIGEVGIWRNCLSLDETERKKNLEYAKKRLDLAEEIGANCCVNVAGNRGEIWDGFSIENYSDDTYALIVDMAREIIDAVNPKHTFFTLEPMPWMIPDSPESYLQLIKDVDRKAFGVHLDYVNMINSPRKHIESTKFIQSCFDLLGPYIKSIHGKDSIMENAYTTVIRETMPGKGNLDYTKILPMVQKLGKDTVFFTEHLPDEESYLEATGYIRKMADKAGVEIILPKKCERN